jgi:hypothetical protein
MARQRTLLGEVNLLGLQAFEGGVSPLWGTIIGGSVSGVTSMALAHTGHAGRRELYGLLAGLGASGVMLAMPSTRKAAFGAAVGAFLASGLGLIEKMLFPIEVAKAAVPTGPVAGMGMAKLNYLNGLKGRQVSYLNGLGIPSIAPQPQSVGTIPGVAGLGMRRQANGTYLNGPAFAGTQMGGNAPVSLLGNASARSDQVSLMGGPQIHGLSAAYGATLLGGS